MPIKLQLAPPDFKTFLRPCFYSMNYLTPTVLDIYYASGHFRYLNLRIICIVLNRVENIKMTPTFIIHLNHFNQ